MGIFDKAKKAWENKVEPELKNLEKEVKEVWRDEIKPALDHVGDVIGFVTKDPSKDLCADNIIDCDKIHWDAMVRPLEGAAKTLGKIISDDEVNCIKSKVSIQLGEPSSENKFHNYKLALNHMISIGQNECSLATKAALKAIDAKGLVDSIVRSVETHHEKWLASFFKPIEFKHIELDLNHYISKNIGVEAFFENAKLDTPPIDKPHSGHTVIHSEQMPESNLDFMRKYIDDALATLEKAEFEPKFLEEHYKEYTPTDITSRYGYLFKNAARQRIYSDNFVAKIIAEIESSIGNTAYQVESLVAKTIADDYLFKNVATQDISSYTKEIQSSIDATRHHIAEMQSLYRALADTTRHQVYSFTANHVDALTPAGDVYQDEDN